MAPPPDNVNFIHPPSLNKAALSPGNKGALRGALCMSLRSKLGVSQAWGDPNTIGFPWFTNEKTCWIVYHVISVRLSPYFLPKYRDCYYLPMFLYVLTCLYCLAFRSSLFSCYFLLPISSIGGTSQMGSQAAPLVCEVSEISTWT